MAGRLRISSRPLIALTVGDPAGIGPELVEKAIRDMDIREAMRLLVLGPGSLRPDDVPISSEAIASLRAGVAWHDTGEPGHEGSERATGTWRPWTMGTAQASCGRAALAALRKGAELAAAGEVDALVTSPVCKEALHLAGEHVEGQTELLGRWADAPRTEMIAVANKLRVMLLTRHRPLADAIASITQRGVLDHLVLLDETLKSWGFAAPQLGLAGLNPHAGEGGLLGTEEQEVLEPAVAEARARGIDVSGPHSPDTMFAQAASGRFDAVLALYHDQAFIPIKLHAPRTAFTVLAGLPYLRLSPAHGTAFDIAGRGIASTEALFATLHQAADWCRDVRNPV